MALEEKFALRQKQREMELAAQKEAEVLAALKREKDFGMKVENQRWKQEMALHAALYPVLVRLSERK